MINPSLPRAGISGTLKNRPFHAKFEIITGVQPSPDDGAWVTEMFRNRAGSVRTEISGHQFGWILDAKRQQLIVFDYNARVAVVSSLKVPEPADSIPRWGFHKFPMTTEESASILGVSCKKVILWDDKAQSHPAGEIWIADNLGIVMQDTKPQPEGSTVWRVVSIDQSEPDPSVFEVPQGYDVAGQ